MTQKEHEDLKDRFTQPYDPYYNQRPYEVREEEEEIYKKLHKKTDFFYSWECVSLYDIRSTVDFVVKDREQLFALLTVLNH